MAEISGLGLIIAGIVLAFIGYLIRSFIAERIIQIIGKVLLLVGLLVFVIGIIYLLVGLIA